MKHCSKDPLDKKRPSAKSLNELMDLLGKLNAKLREKISPYKKEEDRLENMEMVIIILSRSSESTPRTRSEKPKPFRSERSDWINSLCEDIEQGFGRRNDH
jgi:hypothetical protein